MVRLGRAAEPAVDRVGMRIRRRAPPCWCRRARATSLSEVLHYFKKDGTEISEKEYNNPTLLDIFKGPIIAEEVEGDDWSGWSQPYENPAGERDYLA